METKYSINPKSMWKRDQMGEENECVFRGAVCFLQNQICGKPAEPTSCLVAESGFLTVSGELGEVPPSSPHPSNEGRALHDQPSKSCELWLVGNVCNKGFHHWFCKIPLAGSFQVQVVWITHQYGWLAPFLPIMAS